MKGLQTSNRKLSAAPHAHCPDNARIVERGAVEFSRERVVRGHQSTVITAGGRLADQIQKDGGMLIEFDVCSKNPLTFLLRVLNLQTVFGKLQPDILHARSRVANSDFFVN